MAYDEGLASRVRDVFGEDPDVVEKKMFGGLCYLESGNMVCGITRDTFMARVGPDQYEECLKTEHAREMDFTGKPMKGMIFVAPEGVAEDEDLAVWINRCLAFVKTLPPKK
jgi:hypothetical protein